MGFEDQRIAIIGGGLGGMPFLNAALHVGLTNMQLYEQAAQFSEVGAGINITQNANRIQDRYGLRESMLQKSSRPNLPCYMEYRHYRTGEYLGHVDEFGEPRARLLHRAHLLEMLRERVPDSVVNLNKRLRSIGKSDGGGGTAYRLFFEDGTSTEADIVIGCDGIKSVVRKVMGITGSPKYSGQVVYRVFVDYKDLSPETAQLSHKTVNFRGPKRHILILPIGNDESRTARAAIIGFMSEPLESSKSSESWMARSPIDELAEHVRDWCPAVQDIIAGPRKGSPDGKMMKQALYVRDPLDKWYEVNESNNTSSGIILVGDSAHSTLPHQGMKSAFSPISVCVSSRSGFSLPHLKFRARNLHGHRMRRRPRHHPQTLEDGQESRPRRRIPILSGSAQTSHRPGHGNELRSGKASQRRQPRSTGRQVQSGGDPGSHAVDYGVRCPGGYTV